MVLRDYMTRFKAKFLRMAEYHMQTTAEIAYSKMPDSSGNVQVVSVCIRGTSFRGSPHKGVRRSPNILKENGNDGFLYKKRSSSQEVLVHKEGDFPINRNSCEAQIMKKSCSLSDGDITMKSYSRTTSNTSTADSLTSGGKFRATQLWNDVIGHLKENVQVKRRRIKMRSHDSCFTGCDAVDSVLDRLQEEKLNFTKEVSRDKAVKLCQLLMEHHVFECVSRASDVFEDNRTLYRFLDEDPEQDSSKENHSSSTSGEDVDEQTPMKKKVRGNKSSNSDSDFYQSDGMIVKHGQIVQELMDITGAWKRYSSECLRKLTPAKLFTRRPSDVDLSDSVFDDKFSVPTAVQEEVWREVVLGRLLMVVDLPILDSILSDDTPASTSSKSRSKAEMAYSNMAFTRYESFSSLVSAKAEDLWMEAALDCLECLPTGIVMLDLSLAEDSEMTQKLRLYQGIVDHYRESKSPEALWSDKFADLQLALYNLLMQGKRGQVLRALQLGMILLPKKKQEELKRLLAFMKIAAEDDSIQLSVKEDNRMQVEKSLSTAIIRSKVMAPHQVGQLVLFMMDQVERVFHCPDEVEDDVQTRLEEYIKGVLPPTSITYCQRVSGEQFHKQQMDETERALVELINSILNDTATSMKEKKQRLKQFQKHHSELFRKYFSDIS